MLCAPRNLFVVFLAQVVEVVVGVSDARDCFVSEDPDGQSRLCGGLARRLGADFWVSVARVRRLGLAVSRAVVSTLEEAFLC